MKSNLKSAAPYLSSNEALLFCQDHPPQIIKKIPRSIEKRFSCLSSTKEIFENSKGYYKQHLQQCSYNK